MIEDQGVVEVIDLKKHTEFQVTLNNFPIVNYKIKLSNIKNIMLIDKTIENSELFFSSNNDETLPIYYNYYTDREKLFDYLQKEFNSIDRICFAFDNSMMNNKIFLNSEMFFTEMDIIEFENNKESLDNYSNNVKFLIKIIKEFNINRVDFLACNSLQYNNWNKYYSLLEKFTSTIIGASKDLTGNINYGGNWIMENTDEDIQNIYFNGNIANYSSTLFSSSITYQQLTFSGRNVFLFVLNTKTTFSNLVLTSFTNINFESNATSSQKIYNVYYREKDIGNFTLASYPDSLNINLLPNKSYEIILCFNTLYVYLYGSQTVGITTILASSNELVMYPSNSTVADFNTFNPNNSTTYNSIKADAVRNQSLTLNYYVYEQNATSPTITSFSIQPKTFGESPFQITAPTSNSSGAFSYISSNLLVATISGNTITIVGVGNSTIIANQEAAGIYSVGTAFTTFTVNQGTPTISFSITPKTLENVAFVPTPTSNSTGAFTYSSSNTSVATTSGNTIRIVGVGTSTITANQGATTNFTSGTATTTLTVTTGSPIPYYMTSNSNSTFASDFASIQNDGTYTIWNVDDAVRTITLTNSFVFNNNSYNTIYLNSNGTLGFNSASNISNGYPDTNRAAQMIGFFLNWADIDSSLPYNIYYKEDIVNKTFNVLFDTIYYYGRTSKSQFEFTLFLNGNSNSGNALFNFGIMDNCNVLGSSSVVGFSFGSGNTGNLVTSVNLNITNTFNSPSSPYLQYSNIQSQLQNKQILVSSKQTPNIGAFIIPSPQTFDTSFVIVDPSSNSDGSFNYISSSNALISISGNLATVNSGTGTCTITAQQQATSNYNSASIQSNTITLAKATTTITNFSMTYNPPKNVLSIPFTIREPSSNRPGPFIYDSLNSSVATISGNTVTIQGPGTSLITANQSVTTNYTEGSQSSILFVSNICFPAGTLITIDQGIIPIEKINPKIHTIHGKKIVGITQTISTYDFLICFEKHAVSNNVPSQKTYMTHGHEVFCYGKMRKAIECMEFSEEIYKTKYRGEILYNVLMEKHDKMLVNNLLCETLSPENPIAKLYCILKDYTPEEQGRIAKEYNEFTIKNNKFSSKQLKHLNKCL